MPKPLRIFRSEQAPHPARTTRTLTADFRECYHEWPSRSSMARVIRKQERDGVQGSRKHLALVCLNETEGY